MVERVLGPVLKTSLKSVVGIMSREKVEVFIEELIC